MFDAARAWLRQFWRFALLQVVMLVGITAVIGVAGWIVQANLPGIIGWLGTDVAALDDHLIGFAALVSAVVIVLALPFLAAGAAATARLADSALAAKRARLWRATAEGFRRFFPVLGTLALSILLVLASAVLAAVAVAAGLLGLLITGIVVLLRRGKPEVAARWPEWRFWGFSAIPFAWLWRFAPAAVLALPATVLEGVGPARAFRIADREAAGRRWPILGVFLIAVLVLVGVSWVAGELGQLLWGELGSSLVGAIVPLLVLPLPVIAAVALYRRAAGPTGRVSDGAPADPAPRRQPSAVPGFARIAQLTVVALIVSTSVVALPAVAQASPGAAASAAPATTAPAESGVIVVNDANDSSDVVAAQTACETAAEGCTVRGAIAAANDFAATTALTAITITFSGIGEIDLIDTLTFQPEGGAGTLTIDGGGTAVLDGQSMVQILSATSETWSVTLQNLTLQNGYGAFGGAVSAGVPLLTVDRVLAQHDTASIGGGAIFARDLTVTRSTFIDDHVAYGGDHGGAIDATGVVAVTNSTFQGDSIGDQFTTVQSGGSDIYVQDSGDGSPYSLTVVNSTFADFRGGSLALQWQAEAVAASSVRNSVFAGIDGLSCVNITAGSRNQEWHGANSCPGAGLYGSVTLGTLDTSGPIPVIPLNPNADAEGLTAGTDCPATDALGTARDSASCTLGAVEFDGGTTTTVTVTPSTADFGVVTVQAAIGAHRTPSGSVAFDITVNGGDASTYGASTSPVALATVTGDQGFEYLATQTLTGLSVGDVVSASATFTPDNGLLGSTGGPVDATLAPLSASVSAQCAMTGPECLGGDWHISEAQALALTVAATDPRSGYPLSGTFWASFAPDGSDPIATGSTITSLTAAQLGGLGSRDLYIGFLSGDGQYAGATSARPIRVLAAPTVTLSGPVTGTYGDIAGGTWTVTVAGSHGAPTGTVEVFGRSAVLLPVDGSHSTATVDLSQLPVDSSSTLDLVAQYDGDVVYGRADSGAAVHYTTTTASTTTTITGVPSGDPGYDSDIDVQVTVSAAAPSTGDPIGRVTLRDGAIPIGTVYYDPADAGSADRDGRITYDFTVAASTLHAGTHSLTAVYENCVGSDASTCASGDYAGSQTASATSLTVEQAATTTGLLAVDDPTTYGRDVVLTATVGTTGAGPTPDGTVSFRAGGTLLGTAVVGPDGIASLTVAAAAIGVGTLDLTASYGDGYGDSVANAANFADFAPSTGTVTDFTVQQATPTVTVSGSGSMHYGETSQYTIAVNAPATTGTVSPPDGTPVDVTITPAAGAAVPLATLVLTGGSTTLSLDTITADLPPGDYTIEASYAGDARFSGASGTASLTVLADTTSIDWDQASVTTNVTLGDAADVIDVTVANASTGMLPAGDIVLRWGGLEVGRATLTSADPRGGDTWHAAVSADYTGIQFPGTQWLTASFEPANPGFAPSELRTDSPEQRLKVTVNPIEVRTSVDMAAVFGDVLSATATVQAADGTKGAGSVEFLVTTGTGAQRSYGPDRLVDGSLSLADDLAFTLAPLVVDNAGSWTVHAIYHHDPAQVTTTVVSPDDSAVDQVDISVGSIPSTLAVTPPPAAVPYGSTASVHVAVTSAFGVLVPSGRAWVELGGSTIGHAVVSSPSDGVVLDADGEADLDITDLLATQPAGATYTVRVYFAGSSAWAGQQSSDFTVTTTKVASTTIVGTNFDSGLPDGLYPAALQTPVTYSATVALANGQRPDGVVTFYRDATQLGTFPVTPVNPRTGTASVVVTPTAAWSGTIRAVFTSADRNVAGSEDSMSHSWAAAPLTLAAFSTGSTATYGTPYTVNVLGQLAPNAFLQLLSALRPQSVPRGLVTVTDDGDPVCTISLVQAEGFSPGVGSGSCAIAFASVGRHTVGMTIAADGPYAAATAMSFDVTVGKGTPRLSLDTSAGNVWPGASTVAVAWTVDGPADSVDGGTVTITRNGAIVCTSSSFTGSCDMAVPAFDPAANAGQLTLSYSGATNWTAASTTLAGTISACVPYEAPTSWPAGTATVSTPSIAPDCGGGTGYYSTDTVGFQATAAAGYQITGFADAGVAGRQGFAWDSSAYSIYSDGAIAYFRAQPQVRVSDGRLLPFTASPITQARCATIDVHIVGVPSASGNGQNLNAVSPYVPTGCANNVTIRNGDTWELTARVGSTITVQMQPYFVPQHSKFYGWAEPYGGGYRLRTDVDATATRLTLTVSAESANQNVIAWFGSSCYAAPSIAQPIGGTITTDLGGPNCSDPSTGETGYRFGTKATATLTDTAVQTLTGVDCKTVLFQGNSSNGYRSYYGQSCDKQAWVGDSKAYFDAWNVTGGGWVAGADGYQQSGGQRHATRTGTFTIGEQSFTIGAAYSQCYAVALTVAGSTVTDAKGTTHPAGTTSLSPAPNCPSGDVSQGWYKPGTSVTAKATPDATNHRGFLGWSGLPGISGSAAIQQTVTFTVDTDVDGTASFGNSGDCRVLDLQSRPAGALSFTQDWSLGDNYCASQIGGKGYVMIHPDGKSWGNWLSLSSQPTDPDSLDTIVYAYSTTDEQNNPVSSLWTRDRGGLDLELNNSSTIIAYDCKYVAVNAVVLSPTGQPVSSAGAGNMNRATKDDLGDFIQTNDADCSIGHDPASGYGGYAWVAGGQVVPLEVADPAAYKFVGWSGDVAGTGQTSNVPLALNGNGRRTTAEAVNFNITGTFQAICYTLTLPGSDGVVWPGDAAVSGHHETEVITAPNCPGVDASKHMYLGGTPVVLHASDGSRGTDSVLFRNWSGSVDTTDPTDSHWATVTMAKDRNVSPYYSGLSAGEYITSYGNDVVDGLALGAKVTAGFAAAALSAAAKSLIMKATLVVSVVSYAAQGLEALGVHGAVIDGMKDSATLVNSVIDLMFSPLDCISAWSAGGTGTALYAAQSLLGTTLVATLSAAPQKAVTEGTSTLAQLEQAAEKAKQTVTPAARAALALNGAKNVYEASVNGGSGLDLSQSAADMWGSQSSLGVLSGCMSGKAAASITALDNSLSNAHT